MSAPDKNEKAEKHEIIIVKRRASGHDEGHHGGVWKIAFADFMTAMMAFFLVLWIVNSTSKETRSSIARYFNPVQLADTTAARKGLREAKDEFDASAGRPDASDKSADKTSDKASDKTSEKAQDKPSDKPPAKVGDGKPDAKPDAKAKADPHAGEGKAAAKADAKGDNKSEAKGDSKGDNKPDANKADAKADAKDKPDPHAKPDSHAKAAPAAGEARLAPRRLRPDGEPAPLDRPARFDEDALARDPQAALTALAGEVGPPAAAPDAPRAFRDPFAPVNPGLAGRAAARDADAALAPGQGPTPQEPAGADKRAPDKNASDKNAPDKSVADKPPSDKPLSDKPLSDRALSDELAAAVQKSFAGPDAPGVEVRRTPDGVLISLTDKENFEMFAVGSSEPHPRLVPLMGRVAAMLAKTPGEVVLRGHTDARPFRAGGSDNWRLSSARAAMARQMLLKGGFDAARVARVEGWAERGPRRLEDPLAAENRRIEILVRDRAADRETANKEPASKEPVRPGDKGSAR